MATPSQKPKAATVELRVVKAKKGSVRFETADDVKDAIVDNVYVDRLAAMKALGIEDLDKLKGVKVTIEPIAA